MVNVVLFEPEIPQNTGNISRTCAATGSRLHLVEPLGFKIDDAKLKRAGLDYWEFLDIVYYKSTDDFFERNRGAEFFFFTTKAKHLYTEKTYGSEPFLVFGKETAGIDAEILARNPDRCVRFPMAEKIRSLNLSNAVAIAVYEALRRNGFPGLVLR